MRTSLLLTLSLCLSAAVACAAPGRGESAFYTPNANLGNVMYVGSSCTQGVGTPSWRWPLFKIWVDNGVTQKEVGVNSGNFLPPRSRPDWMPGFGFVYAGKSFYNVHSALVNELAAEVSGRDNSSLRLEDSNIFDWLGLDKSYRGYRHVDPITENPASYFVMIGRCDALNASGKQGIGSCIEATMKSLLGKGGDMDLILKAMREANPDARIAVMTIPTWAPERVNNHRPEDYEAVARYNEALKEWGKSRKVAVIEVNRG